MEIDSTWLTTAILPLGTALVATAGALLGTRMSLNHEARARRAEAEERRYSELRTAVAEAVRVGLPLVIDYGALSSRYVELLQDRDLAINPVAAFGRTLEPGFNDRMTRTFELRRTLAQVAMTTSDDQMHELLAALRGEDHDPLRITGPLIERDVRIDDLPQMLQQASEGLYRITAALLAIEQRAIDLNPSAGGRADRGHNP